MQVYVNRIGNPNEILARLNDPFLFVDQRILATTGGERGNEDFETFATLRNLWCRSHQLPILVNSFHAVAVYVQLDVRATKWARLEQHSKRNGWTPSSK